MINGFGLTMMLLITAAVFAAAAANDHYSRTNTTVKSEVINTFDCSFKDTYPNQYVAYYIDDSEISIDGRLDENAWNDVPFTTNFVDISTTTTPKYETKVKIRWSKNYLYVAAVLEEPEIWANIAFTCHCNTTDEDQVIFHDNDFEIFLDPNGDTHNYKEFEMNAHNATWDLLLNQPYANGGYENSSRLFGAEGFDMQPPLTCGVNIDGGAINSPYSGNKQWTVEVALPIASLIVSESEASLPQEGTYWRINFSRVEWAVIIVPASSDSDLIKNVHTNEVFDDSACNKLAHKTDPDYVYIKNASCQSCSEPGSAEEDNWVWSPMQEVNMHSPEKWGFLQFSTIDPSSSANADVSDFTAPVSVMSPEWPARSMAMLIYNAEESYLTESGHGKYTDDLDELNKYSSVPILNTGTCSSLTMVFLSDDGLSYSATVTTTGSGTNPIGIYTATIDNTRLLRVFSDDNMKIEM